MLAASARALARAAWRAGYRPLAIDLFGDLDTRHFATATVAARARGGRLDAGRVREAVAAWGTTESPVGLVYGGGMERQPDLLAHLAGSVPVFGLAPATFEAISDRAAALQRLADAGVRVAETRSDRVPDRGRWLSKPRRGAGGVGLRRARRGRPCPPGRICQAWLAGRSYGAAFLHHPDSSGGPARHTLIGVTAHWRTRLPRQVPRRLAPPGIVGTAVRAMPDGTPLAEWTRRIAEVLELRGAAGVDFLVDVDGVPVVVDVNPRPCSGHALLAGRYDWLTLHLAACGHRPLATVEAGAQPPWLATPAPAVAAECVIYSRSRGAVPPDVRYPAFIVDRPAPGEAVGPGAPLFTVRAVARAPHQACRRANARLRRWLADEGAWCLPLLRGGTG